jgi:hypothetical protein
MIRRILVHAAVLAFLPVLSARGAQSPTAEQEPQARADALLQHARELTNIRSSGSPSFHLKATFSLPGKDLETLQGTYTEWWVSATQWRREITIGDMRQIEVSGQGKYWIIFPDGYPHQAEKLPPLVAVLPPVSQTFDFVEVSEHTNAGLVADCAYTKPVIPGLQSSLCFEKSSGLLMQEVSPEKRQDNIVRYSCGFRTFRRFGDRLFPRDLTCFEDRHKTITVAVTDLSFEPNPDPVLFGPVPGAPEIPQCSGKVAYPNQVRWGLTMTPTPDQIPGHVPMVKVWLVVDTKGEPQDIRIMDIPREGWADALLKGIQTWRYVPGTCDGKPMSMLLTAEVPALLMTLAPRR